MTVCTLCIVCIVSLTLLGIPHLSGPDEEQDWQFLFLQSIYKLFCSIDTKYSLWARLMLFIECQRCFMHAENKVIKESFLDRFEYGGGVKVLALGTALL